MRLGVMTAMVGVVLAGLAGAEPMDAKSAKKQLFSPKGLRLEAADVSDVAPDVMAQINAVVGDFAHAKKLKLLERSGYSYYGALAVPTDRTLVPEDLSFVTKLHSRAAAGAAARAACQAATSSNACQVVAYLVPKSFQARDLTLSFEATDRFRKTWTKDAGPKYLAMSPASDAWVIAKGVGADVTALERCNARAVQNGPADCIIVIAEE